MAVQLTRVRFSQAGDAIFVADDGKPLFFLSPADGTVMFMEPPKDDNCIVTSRTFTPTGALAIAINARVAAVKAVPYDWTTQGDRRQNLGRGRRSTDP